MYIVQHFENHYYHTQNEQLLNRIGIWISFWFLLEQQHYKEILQDLYLLLVYRSKYLKIYYWEYYKMFFLKLDERFYQVFLLRFQ